jgi:hypothetical protein
MTTPMNDVRVHRYILDALGEPQVSEDVHAWGEWMATTDRRVADDTIADGPTTIRVVTEFIGIDHNFGAGPPVLWETVVTGGEFNGEKTRYASTGAAQRGHNAMRQRVAETVVAFEPTVRCHCGQPLHYSSPAIQRQVERLNAAAGDQDIVVTLNGRSWRVQRHYIALHGIKAVDLPTLGFAEIRISTHPPIVDDRASLREVFDATLDDRQRVTLILDYGDMPAPETRWVLYLGLGVSGIVMRLLGEKVSP